MNCIIEIAKKKRKEKYITPEDVSDALKQKGSLLDVNAIIREDLLEVLGKQTLYGAEDAGLCAYIAWVGI
jgi:hypothetical protein